MFCNKNRLGFIKLNWLKWWDMKIWPPNSDFFLAEGEIQNLFQNKGVWGRIDCPLAWQGSLSSLSPFQFPAGGVIFPFIQSVPTASNYQQQLCQIRMIAHKKIHLISGINSSCLSLMNFPPTTYGSATSSLPSKWESRQNWKQSFETHSHDVIPLKHLAFSRRWRSF